MMLFWGHKQTCLQRAHPPGPLTRVSSWAPTAGRHQAEPALDGNTSCLILIPLSAARSIRPLERGGHGFRIGSDLFKVTQLGSGRTGFRSQV